MKAKKARERVIELLSYSPYMCKHDIARRVFHDGNDSRVNSIIRVLIDENIIKKASLGTCTDHGVAHKFYTVVERPKRQHDEEEEAEGDKDVEEEEPEKKKSICDRIKEKLASTDEPVCRHGLAKAAFGNANDPRIDYRLRKMCEDGQIEKADFNTCDDRQRLHVRYAIAGSVEQTDDEEDQEYNEQDNERGAFEKVDGSVEIKGLYDKIKKTLASSKKPMCKHMLAEAIFGDPNDTTLVYSINYMVSDGDIEKTRLDVCSYNKNPHSFYSLPDAGEEDIDEYKNEEQFDDPHDDDNDKVTHEKEIYNKITELLGKFDKPVCIHELSKVMCGKPRNNDISDKLRYMIQCGTVEKLGLGSCKHLDRRHALYVLPRDSNEQSKDGSMKRVIPDKRREDYIYRTITETFKSTPEPICRHVLARAVYKDPNDKRIKAKIEKLLSWGVLEKDGSTSCVDHRVHHMHYKLAVQSGEPELESEDEIYQKSNSLKDLLKQAEESHEHFMSAIRGISKILYGDE
ncbi:hypothetical protein ACFL6S_00665 [Candidatus Poribacteria bacterium]